MSNLPCRIMVANCPISVTFEQRRVTFTKAGDWTEKQKKAVFRYLDTEGFMDERSGAELKFERQSTPG